MDVRGGESELTTSRPTVSATPRVGRSAAGDGLVLAAAFVAFWWPILWGGQTLSRSPLASTIHPEVVAEQLGWPVNDSLASAQQDEAWLAFIARSLGRGEWPLFNPHNGLGAPLLESLQPGVLYPLNVILPLLPQGSPWLFDVFSLLHAAVFLVGLRFLYSRVTSAGMATALAILVGLSGLTWQNVNMVHFRGLAWCPWLLGGLLLVVTPQAGISLRGVAVSVMAGLGVITAGNLQDAVFTLAAAALVVSLYGRCCSEGDRLPSLEMRRRLLTPTVLILGMMFVTAGVWFPYVRGVSTGDLSTVADPTRCLEEVPWRWMSSWVIPHVQGLFPTQLVERQFWFLPQPSLPTSLALVASVAATTMFWHGPSTERRWLAGVGGLCGILLLKTVETPLFDWLTMVPVLNGIKFHKYNGIVVILLGLIAATGLERLAQVDESRRRRLVSRTFAVVAVAIGLLLVWLNLDRGWSLKHPLNRDAARFVVQSIAISLGTAALTAIILSRRVERRGMWLAMVWSVQATLLLPPGWLPRIAECGSPWSDLSWSDSNPPPDSLLSPLAPNSNLQIGGLGWDVGQPGVFDPVLNRRFKGFFNRFFTARYPDFALYQLTSPTRMQVSALALLGVREVRGFPPPAGAAVIETGPGRWAPRDTLPEAFWLSQADFEEYERRWQSLPEGDTTSLETFVRDLSASARRHRVNARQTALGAGRCEVYSYRTEPGRVIWLRAFHSGWRRIDTDRSAEPIQPFLGTFLAIPVPVRNWETIQLTAIPASWLFVAFGGVLAGSLLIAACVFWPCRMTMTLDVGAGNALSTSQPNRTDIAAPEEMALLVSSDPSNGVNWTAGRAALGAGLLAVSMFVADWVRPRLRLSTETLEEVRSRQQPATSSDVFVRVEAVADVPTNTGAVVTLTSRTGLPPILVRGLAGHLPTRRSPDRVWVEAGGRLFPAVTGVMRLERPSELAAAEFGRSGWVASLSAEGWRNKTTELTIWCEFGENVVAVPAKVSIRGVEAGAAASPQINEDR